MLHPYLAHLVNPGNAAASTLVPDDCPPPNWGGTDEEWERANHFDIPALPGYRIDAELMAACQKLDKTRPGTPYYVWLVKRISLLRDERLRRGANR
jgi:hypothetical protein